MAISLSPPPAEVSQAELDAHEADTTAVHGISNTAALVNTSTPVALTQTYATADATHAAPTATVLTSFGASANNTLVDVTTASLADPAKCNANFDDVADEVNKLIADLADIKQFVNTIADQLRAKGLAS